MEGKSVMPRIEALKPSIPDITAFYLHILEIAGIKTYVL